MLLNVDYDTRDRSFFSPCTVPSCRNEGASSIFSDYTFFLHTQFHPKKQRPFWPQKKIFQISSVWHIWPGPSPWHLARGLIRTYLQTVCTKSLCVCLGINICIVLFCELNTFVNLTHQVYIYEFQIGNTSEYISKHLKVGIPSLRKSIFSPFATPHFLKKYLDLLGYFQIKKQMLGQCVRSVRSGIYFSEL